MRLMTSWRKELEHALEITGDTLIATTLSDGEMDMGFNPGYGGSNGDSFTAWGKRYVYFPVVYDGSEWIGYAPRNPCDEKTPHQGGQ